MNNNHNPHGENISPSKKKISIITAIVVVIIAGTAIYLNIEKKDEPLMAKIISVNPNMVPVHLPSLSCNNITVQNTVKNKDRTFFNGLFDSKNHPKYVTQKSTKRVCKTIYIESEVQQGFNVNYEIGDIVESMLVENPPHANTTVPLSELHIYPIESEEVNNASAPITNSEATTN